MANQATRNNKAGFYIGVGCPGCGGQLSLDTDFFVLVCKHCGSALRVQMPQSPPVFMVQAEVPTSELRFRVDRFLKETGQALTRSGLQSKCVYYPYWKIDAIMLKVRNRVDERIYVRADGEGAQTESRVERPHTDISLTPYQTTVPAGGELSGLPNSIGLRSSYLKLRPYAREYTQDGFDSIPLTRTWESVWGELQDRSRAVGTIETAEFGKNLTEVFRPMAALVYFPYLIAESYAGDYDRYLVDGVTGRVVSHQEEPALPESGYQAELPQVSFGELGVGLHRCPNCGHDLPSVQSWVYPCPHCHRVVSLDASHESVKRIEVCLPDKPSHDALFPFWTFGIPADLGPVVKKMLGGLHQSDRLAIPAFRTTGFDGAYRLTRRMTAVLPQLSPEPLGEVCQRCQPVGISLAEAVLMAEVAVYRALLGPGYNGAAKPEIVPRDVSLIYAPFRPQNYFYVDSLTGAVTFEKRLVR